ncbi:MAG TPA: hypothetical protein VFN41_09720 [Candidatus Limnocylindrales bacterium]|nr:hypothetical protein [Candidatus Limnocylindrales bacterium]
MLAGLVMVVGSSLTVSAATDTKPYSALWDGTSSSTTIAAGSATAHLFIKNLANPQSLGSANITVPTGYTLTSGSVNVTGGSATKVGNTLQVRNLNLAPNATADVTISVTTPCLAGGAAGTWGVIVKQANNFSGPPGNDFVNSGPAPTTTVSGTSTCKLRFLTQPNTTLVGNVIKSGFDSTGSAIQVEIYDPSTNLRVASNANVSLTQIPDNGATLTGGSTAASAGLATFSTLKLNKEMRYVLEASSPAASNTPDSDAFMVASKIEPCTTADCTFQQSGQNASFTTTPKKITAGASFVSSLNLPGLNISCAGAPYNYPDDRQPNAVWFTYTDSDTTNYKTNVIVIDKDWVQQTPENGASKYRVCYASPVDFLDNRGGGQMAPRNKAVSDFFGGEDWYVGLLPDCGSKKTPPVPCMVGWTGDAAGTRTGTFLTPGGDPGYR